LWNTHPRDFGGGMRFAFLSRDTFLDRTIADSQAVVRAPEGALRGRPNRTSPGDELKCG